VVARHALELEGALRSEDEAALALRLARLDAALATVLDAARELPAQEAQPAAPAQPAPDPDETCALHGALAQMLDLLQNNNMKAMAHFEALRPVLARVAPTLTRQLADAVATLRFDTAAALVQALLQAPLDTEENT
jgi:hypothetical protein